MTVPTARTAPTTTDLTREVVLAGGAVSRSLQPVPLATARRRDERSATNMKATITVEGP